MLEILGVVKLVPVTRAAPPEAFAYQLIVPAVVEADKATVPASHRLLAVPVTVGVMLIVAVTGVLAEVQVPVAAST